MRVSLAHIIWDTHVSICVLLSVDYDNPGFQWLANARTSTWRRLQSNLWDRIQLLIYSFPEWCNYEGKLGLVIGLSNSGETNERHVPVDLLVWSREPEFFQQNRKNNLWATVSDRRRPSLLGLTYSSRSQQTWNRYAQQALVSGGLWRQPMIFITYMQDFAPPWKDILEDIEQQV